MRGVLLMGVGMTFICMFSVDGTGGGQIETPDDYGKIRHNTPGRKSKSKLCNLDNTAEGSRQREDILNICKLSKIKQRGYND